MWGPWQRPQCSVECSPHAGRDLGTNSPLMKLPRSVRSVQVNLPDFIDYLDLKAVSVAHALFPTVSALLWGWTCPEGSSLLGPLQHAGHLPLHEAGSGCCRQRAAPPRARPHLSSRAAQSYCSKGPSPWRPALARD